MIRDIVSLQFGGYHKNVIVCRSITQVPRVFPPAGWNTRTRIDFSNRHWLPYYPRLYSRYYFQSKVTFYCLASNYPNSCQITRWVRDSYFMTGVAAMKTGHFACA